MKRNHFLKSSLLLMMSEELMADEDWDANGKLKNENEVKKAKAESAALF